MPTRPAASQTLNVVRYTKGQEFKSHLDASSGRSSRHEQGFIRSTRLVSVVCARSSWLAACAQTHARARARGAWRAHHARAPPPLTHHSPPAPAGAPRSVYLNSPRRGGKTVFPWIRLAVRPKKGMALLHFPASLGFFHDPRTVHAAAPAIDEKWVMVTWMWMHPREGTFAKEAGVPELSGARI